MSTHQHADGACSQARIGILALLLGLAAFFGTNLPLFPRLLILLGAKVIFDVLQQEPAPSSR